MSRLRQALSFENVLVTAVAFVVLAGGTAFAANQLAKNSVGSKQLKKNSVTAAKIKKNAVAAAKIKNGAVNGAKIKDGSLELSKMNLESVPYGRIVHTAKGSSPLVLNEGTEPVSIPLEGSAYTQPPGRDDSYSGSLEVTFSPTCEAPRVLLAFLTLDQPPTSPEGEGVASVGYFISETEGGAGTYKVNLGTYTGSGISFQLATARNHTLALGIAGGCKGGSATVTNASASVLGVGG